MKKKKIVKYENDTENFDISEYKRDIKQFFDNVPCIAEPLLDNAKLAMEQINKMLYTVPSFIDAVKEAIPDVTLQAILTNDQKQQIAKGAIKLMTKKDGSLLANLVNPETKKIVATIPLESVQKMSPGMTKAMVNFSNQMQMAQIAEQIQHLQLATEEVRQGQENDRLATAYSCQQKFLQAMEIRNPDLRNIALLQIASSAEDSRNLLMLSQKENVDFLKNQPESFVGKFFSGASADQINQRIFEIRESICAINTVSFAEAMAYQEMGESSAARKSLMYYSEFVYNTYLETPDLIERLDLIDPSPENHFSDQIKGIYNKIQLLPCTENRKLIENQNKRRK